MKAFVTSVGEKTTDICCELLKKFGFDVILLDEKEKWIDKYKRFINLADEDCVRIDADIIPNENIKEFLGFNMVLYNNYYMVQNQYYDIYRNKVVPGHPLYYSDSAIEIIKNNLDKLHPNRPETSAWRLGGMNDSNFTTDIVMGIHGIYQDEETVERAKQNKIDRKQIGEYNFDLINKLMKL